MDNRELYEKVDEKFESTRPRIDEHKDAQAFFKALKAWQGKKDILMGEFMNGKHTNRKNLDVPGQPKADYVEKVITDES
jgi:hypothetical protein